MPTPTTLPDVTAAPDEDPLLRAARIGARRAKARREAAAAGRELRDAVRAAHAAGHTKAEIARVAQISRVALDDMLRDD